MSEALTSVAIIGGDLHAWSAAVKLSSSLGQSQGDQQVSITLVDNQPKAIPAVLSFGTSVHSFHSSLGFKESDLIARVGGSYKYGTIYQNWIKPNGIDFLYTYSPSGQMINRVDFHHYVNRLRLQGKDVSLEPFSIAAMAASEQRFTHPEPNSPLEKIDYSLQLDSARYTQFLKAIAVQQGVNIIEASVETVDRDAESGLIKSIALDNGDSLQADFYFDSSGEQSRLLGEALGVGFESWSQWFPCDRRMEITRQTKASTPLVNTLIHTGAGWQQVYPMPGVCFEQHTYCSDLVNDEAILALSKAQLDSPILENLRQVVTQTPGIRDRFWAGNCLALGDAAGFAETLYFDPLHFTHTALDRWLELYPTKKVNPLLAEQYNMSTRKEYSHVRDVHALRLATMAGTQSPLTEKLHASEWPETLQHRIDLFRATGRVAFYESDVLEKHQWVSMLIGCGVWPERYDPLLNSTPLDGLEQHLFSMAASVNQLVAKLPNHDALLNAIRTTAE